jgi:long-chain fatty acid transport protein
MTRISKQLGYGLATALVATLGAQSALANGFAVREQSAMGQGASFAGSGASKALSSMFWNSAAVTALGGTNTDANISAILPEGELTAVTGSTRNGTSSLGKGFNESTEIGRNAYVPASYLNHQFKAEPRLFLGLGVNAPFGLKTEPDKRWVGSEVGGATSLFTTNFNPVLGYKFSDQLSVGIGAQFEYAKGVFKFATGSPTGPNSFFEGDSLAAGATAGLTYSPTPATIIGLGWRSQLTHKLEGRFGTSAAAGIPTAVQTGVTAEVELRLPDIVTLSLNQAIAPNLTLLGTVEWTNWSRFGGLEVVSTGTGAAAPLALVGKPTNPGSSIGVIDAPWSDGWFFSGGLEYAVSPALTVRAGGAYEISPVRNAKDRILGIPDADRIWASLGFSYNVNKATTIDFGYSHLFVEEVQVDRLNINKNVRILADLDASADIFSLGLRMKLGE